MRRLDNAAKLDGTASYAIDALPPGLLYASIKMCPTVGGKVASFDAAQALSLKGVTKVMSVEPVQATMGGTGTLAGGVAVIADTPWHAMRALEAVQIEWDHGAAVNLSSAGIFASLTQALDSHAGSAHLQRGDATKALKGAAKTITAEYRVPFLAHATMEPMNCTVQFANGAATVWASTQAPDLARDAVAKVLGVDAAKVEIKVPFLGGGFGRRYLSDCMVQAAHLARATGGAPVQLIWSREEDITHDFYRPAFIARCEGGFDAAGSLIAWKLTSAGSNMGAPSFIGAEADGAANTPYRVPNMRFAHAAVESPVTMGIWRSVANSQNAFFIESFVDELAAGAGVDPLALRATLLAGDAPALRVLNRAAQLCGWGTAPVAPDGTRRARGIALHRCFGSTVAQVAEVSVNAAREIRVHRVTCVIDCGVAVNPNLIRQQIEGGMIFGLSAALHGQITIEKGQVQQSNFHDYVPLRMSECPEIRTEIIADGTTPGGVGETGTPPIAPAVANAVFALTGQRLRELPLKAGVMLTLNINGRTLSTEAEADTPLLWVLRGELQLPGTKFGCGKALCGACTVHLDGVAVRSCVTPVSAAAGHEITTIEALNDEVAQALRRAWTEIDVVQCGYCQSGQLMSASALLKMNPQPSDADIDAAMSGNICRCGTYPRIRAAIHLAAKAR